VKASNYDSCRYSSGIMNLGPYALPVPFVTLYRPVAGADARTYRVLGYEPDYWITEGKTDFRGSYAVDRAHFFYGDKIVAGVRPEDVRMGDGFAHDGRNVYIKGAIRPARETDYTKVAPGFFKSGTEVRANDMATALPLLDPETFSFIEDCHGAAVCYARTAEDKNFRYAFRGHTGMDGWIVEKKPGSPREFRDLGCGYSLIDGTVYFGVQRIANADPATFTTLIAFKQIDWCHQGWYARDGQRVYYRGEPIADADVESFVAFCDPHFSLGLNMFAFDKNHRYREGAVLSADRVDIWRHFDRGLAHFRSGIGQCPDEKPMPLAFHR